MFLMIAIVVTRVEFSSDGSWKRKDQGVVVVDPGKTLRVSEGEGEGGGLPHSGIQLQVRSMYENSLNTFRTV